MILALVPFILLSLVFFVLWLKLPASPRRRWMGWLCIAAVLLTILTGAALYVMGMLVTRSYSTPGRNFEPRELSQRLQFTVPAEAGDFHSHQTSGMQEQFFYTTFTLPNEAAALRFVNDAQLKPQEGSATGALTGDPGRWRPGPWWRPGSAVRYNLYRRNITRRDRPNQSDLIHEALLDLTIPSQPRIFIFTTDY